MSLADWLQGGRTLGERLEALEHLCGALETFHTGRRVATRPALHPGQIEIGSEGEWHLVPADNAPDQQPVPEYRAPELIDDLVPYERSADIYSMGVLAYELLAGRHPFVVPTPLGSIEAAANVPPPALADVAKDVPRELAEAVMPCLERDPEWRPKDLSYLLEMVRKARRQHPAPRRRAPVKAAARPPVASAPERATPTINNAARPAGVARSAGTSRVPLIAASVGGMLVLLGGVWWLTRPPSGPEPTGAPSHAAATPAPVVAASAEPSADPAAARVLTEPTSTGTSPTPTPATTPTPTPAPTPSALPSPVSTTTARVATAAATPAPVEMAPLPVAVVTPLPEPARATTPSSDSAAQAPAAPAVITALVPAKLRKGATVLIDVRGSGLRPGLQARLAFRGREPASGVQVVGQRFVNATLLTLMLKIDDQAREGNYALILADAQGNVSNARPFDIGR